MLALSLAKYQTHLLLVNKQNIGVAKMSAQYIFSFMIWL